MVIAKSWKIQWKWNLRSNAKQGKKGDIKSCIIPFRSTQSFKIDNLSDSSWRKLRNNWSETKCKGSKTALRWNLQKCTD